jgi:hypothetical protein
MAEDVVGCHGQGADVAGMPEMYIGAADAGACEGEVDFAG